MNDGPTTQVSFPERAPGARTEVRLDRQILDRTARRQRVRTLRIAIGVVGLAGTALFSGLAAMSTHASVQHQTVTPDQQIQGLENANGGSFFSGGATNAPSTGVGPPQTSSGGS